jgi:hypothetical protein
MRLTDSQIKYFDSTVLKLDPDKRKEHTHNALDDARSQAEIFQKILAASRKHV